MPRNTRPQHRARKTAKERRAQPELQPAPVEQNARHEELAKMQELCTTGGLYDVIEFQGWLPPNADNRLDPDIALDMDSDGDMIRGNRRRVILDDVPPVKVLITPGTAIPDVKRMLQNILTMIDRHGMPESYVCYGELYLPPHVKRRLKTGKL